MKKIICLLCLLMLIQNVFAKDHFDIGFINYSQGVSGSISNISAISVVANAGDSVCLWTSIYSGIMLVPPDFWSFNGFPITGTNNIMNITVIINQSGVYSAETNAVVIPDMDFYITNITGIPSIKNINFLNIFPTAATSSITIQLNSIKTNDIEISFFDMHGRQLKNDFYKNVFGEFIKNENTEALAKGIYFLRIKAGDDVVEKKFVKM